MEVWQDSLSNHQPNQRIHLTDATTSALRLLSQGLSVGVLHVDRIYNNSVEENVMRSEALKQKPSQKLGTILRWV